VDDFCTKLGFFTPAAHHSVNFELRQLLFLLFDEQLLREHERLQRALCHFPNQQMNSLQLVAGRLETVHEMRTGSEGLGLDKLRANIELLKESKAMLTEAQQNPNPVGVDPAVVDVYLTEVMQELQYYEDYMALFEHTQDPPLLEHSRDPPTPLSEHMLAALDQVQRWQCPLEDEWGDTTALLALRTELRGPLQGKEKRIFAVPPYQRFNLACLVYDAEVGNAHSRAGNFHTWLLGVLGSRFALEPRLEEVLVALLWATVQTEKQARRVADGLNPNIYSDRYKALWETRA